MATHSEYPSPEGGGQKKAIIAAAVTSAAVLISITVWGYELVMRDVRGVPVVMALEGPVRVLPDDPGGIVQRNTGFSVNSVVEQGTVPAPELTQQIVVAGDSVDVTLQDLDLPVELTDVVQLPQTDGVVPLSTEQIIDKANEISGNQAFPDAYIEQEPASLPVALAVAVPRPQARPQALASAAVVNTALQKPQRVVTPQPGSMMVQLGAYNSVDVAEQQWLNFSLRFPGYLEGKEKIIERAERGGSVFYRLRALNYADVADARRFCAAIVTDWPDCVVVVAR